VPLVPTVGCPVPAVAGLKLLCVTVDLLHYLLLDLSLDEETRAVHGMTTVYVEFACSTHSVVVLIGAIT